MAFKKVSHVLFDLDGLLIDSEILYTQAFTNVCAKYDKEFTWELKSSLLGFQGHECAEKITRTLDLPLTVEEFMKLCQKEYEVLFPKVQLMPGAQRLVEHLHRKGVPLALATSSAQDSVDMKMRNFKEFLGLFHHLTMGSTDPEVTKGKPDPAIFLVCASRFPDKPEPEHLTKQFVQIGASSANKPLCGLAEVLDIRNTCLVFEDAVNGVKAANAANMQVVAIPDPRIDHELLNTATLVLNSLEEFQPEVFGLPAFE